MGIQYVCWIMSAVSAGYVILSMVRPVIVGGKLRITIPWRVPRIGEKAVFWSCRQRVIATVVATGGDLILPGGVICHLPPEGNPAADVVYEILSRSPEAEEVPIGHIYIQRRGITTIVPAKSRVGTILI